MRLIDTEGLKHALESLEPYQPGALLDLYQRECRRQETDAPLLTDIEQEEFDLALEEAAEYMNRGVQLGQKLARLQPRPAPIPCPEFGL